MQTETPAVAQRLLVCRISHGVVRSLVSLSFPDGIAEILSPWYAHAVANGPLADYFVRWLLISSIALPLYTVIELILMWEVEEETAAVGIDAIFAFAWFAFFWISVFHAFTHHVLFVRTVCAPLLRHLG